MSRKKKSKKQNAVEQPAAPQKEHKNIFKIESELFAKKYTNERIRKQIDNDSFLFFAIMGMWLFSFFLIALSFINAYKDIRPEKSLSLWWHVVRNDHPLGMVFGLTIIVVACVGMHETGILNMFKHIFPACSGKIYNAKKIDELANDPDTLLIKEVGVYATPEALIGINKGLTVVCYDDIASISLKAKHHSENLSHRTGRSRSVSMAVYHALTDRYKEWNTYYIIVKTKNHRRLVLTETAYIYSYESLIPVLDKKCSNVEYKIKEQKPAS